MRTARIEMLEADTLRRPLSPGVADGNANVELFRICQRKAR